MCSSPLRPSPCGEGINQLIHASVTSSFGLAYVVLAIAIGFDLVSLHQSGGQMSRRARRSHRALLEMSWVTSDSMLRAVFVEDVASVSGDAIALAALANNQITGHPYPKEWPRCSSR